MFLLHRDADDGDTLAVLHFYGMSVVATPHNILLMNSA